MRDRQRLPQLQSVEATLVELSSFTAETLNINDFNSYDSSVNVSNVRFEVHADNVNWTLSPLADMALLPLSVGSRHQGETLLKCCRSDD